MLTLACLANKY